MSLFMGAQLRKEVMLIEIRSDEMQSIVLLCVYDLQQLPLFGG